jgi:hypothetical protein
VIQAASRRSVLRNDDGAYAILYAVIIVVILAIAALVIDVGMVRTDRRANRAATDAAAIAGAGALGLGGQDPVAACTAAMRYAEASIGVTTAGADNCASTFAGTPTLLCRAGVPLTASESVAGRTIFVTWPVLDSSTYMTTPDLEKWSGIPSSQPAQSGASGNGPDGFSCIRVGVAIQQAANTLFGTGLGFGGRQGTESRSVAKTVPNIGKGSIPAPLVVLDQHACNALSAKGNGTGAGGVVVNAAASATLPDGTTVQFPGVIAIDSDGTSTGGGSDNGTSCSGNGSTAITTTGGSRIWALDSASTEGSIISKALQTNNTLHAYATGDTAGCPPSGQAWPVLITATPPPALCRVPTAGERVTDEPWLNRYDCTTTIYTSYTQGGFPCTERPLPSPPYPQPRDYVDQWQRFAQGVVAAGGFAGGLTIPGVINGANIGCTINSDLVVNGDVFVNCPDPAGLTIKASARVSFMGMVVSKGSISVANSSTPPTCLMFNDTDASHCTSLLTPVVASLPPPDGGNVYIGGGLNLDSGASFVDNQSFIFLNGRLSSNAGQSSGSVADWVAPYASQDASGCVPATSSTSAPSSGCFNSLALWSPYAGNNQGGSQDFMTGGGSLYIDGTLFMGYTAFNYAGQAQSLQTRAQLVCRLLQLTGGSLLNMTPDSDRSTSIPAGAGQLIR